MGRYDSYSDRRSRSRQRDYHDKADRYREEHRQVPTPTRSRSSRDYDDRHSRATLTSRHESERRETSRYRDASRSRERNRSRRDFPHNDAAWHVEQNDDDRRLDPLQDDPRHFEGAELGKAQKAAMGITGLLGRNTASFDPNSTLIRPAFRCEYGVPGKRYGKTFTPDDVVMVPDFFCKEDDLQFYNSLSEELRQIRKEGGEDLNKVESFHLILRKVCKYFRVEQEACAAKIAWDRKGDDKFWEIQTPNFDEVRGNCTCIVNLGAERELAFWNKGKEDSISLSQRNGLVTLYARDVIPSWKRAVAAYRPKENQEARGYMAITIVGTSSELVENKLLGPKHVKKTAADAGPCRDFKHGRCNYGDRCRFSHGEAAESKEASIEPFDPTRTVVRPSIRIMVEPETHRYPRPVKHDDAIIVPSFYSEEESWDIYYQLIKEMRESQAKGQRRAEWIPWHEGAHLLSQNPEGSPLFKKIQDKMTRYFNLTEENRGTRFNWYRDGSDWKPFHHDSAAFNAQRAKTQNCTVGISFGSNRELAFRHAQTEELIYFPQPSGTLFFFGQDCNILWQHGLNALPKEEQDGKGRISLILWGKCQLTVDEAGSPPLLSDESRGKGKGKGKDKGKGKGKGKDYGFSMHGHR